MKKIYYEKVGRKYVPVKEYDSDFLDSFSKGNHLVISHPGGKSARYNIDPAYAPMIAAGRIAEVEVVRAIMGAIELRPKKQPITKRQQELWRELAESFRREDYALIRPSAIDAADAAVNAMMDEAKKLLTNPSVKKAYEHFLLVCELTKEETKDE